MVVLSDVIYPPADINDYVNGFYIRTRATAADLRAARQPRLVRRPQRLHVPFCGAGPLPHFGSDEAGGLGDPCARTVAGGASRPGPPAPDHPAARRARLRRRSAAARRRRPAAVQPAPYFAIELAELLLVAIDTGVDGELDAEQGEWLRRMSRRPKPKVLLTGKPISVNERIAPGDPIAWDDASPGADASTTSSANPPIATSRRSAATPTTTSVPGAGSARGRSSTSSRRGRRATCRRRTRSRGGGSTELGGAPRKGGLALTERDFRCYPLRGDSLALFCRRVGPVLFKLLVALLSGAAMAAVQFFWLITLDADRRLAARARSRRGRGCAVTGPRRAGMRSARAGDLVACGADRARGRHGVACRRRAPGGHRRAGSSLDGGVGVLRA